MAQTVSTSSTTLCPATELTKRYDWRRIADLVATASTRTAAPTVPNSKSAVESDASVAAALLSASGWLLAACQVAERYSPADLEALTGASQALMYQVVADLAFWHLYKFRNPTTANLLEGYKDAQEFLQRLRLGERIFGFEETADAGVQEAAYITQAQINTQGLTTKIGRRLFGRRVKEERLGPTGNC